MTGRAEAGAPAAGRGDDGGDPAGGREAGAGDRPPSTPGDRARVESLQVESIAVGGDGVARQESGRVVFVPRTAPGDEVRARITEEHGSYARAAPVEVVRAGPDRREAPCPHSATCGACQLQHLDYEAQLAVKRQGVEDTLERIGGRAIDVPPVVGAESTLGYRNRVTLTVRRGLHGVVAGYHRWDAPDRLVDVRHCPLAEPAVQRAWSRLRSAWGPGARRLPEGRELRVTLRASARGEVTLLVEQAAPPDGAGGAGTGPGDDAGDDVEMRAAPVEDALGDLLPADVAVVNPPRAGLSSRVAEALSAAPLGALAYVSCDPATLARDLDRLGDGWAVASLFDAFPLTSHVETAAWLEAA